MREAPGDDTDLVGRLRAGDPRAFEELVRIHQHRVFGVALRMLGSRAVIIAAPAAYRTDCSWSHSEPLPPEASSGTSKAPWKESKS